jgi:hypothetical protein
MSTNPDILITAKIALDKKALDKAMKEAEASMRKFRGALLGASLSMLFFGMALKRVFDSAWRFGTKTFNDIMHSVDGTVTSFDQMNNAMAYLGFTIGQALEPVAAFLTPIIMATAEWVSNNQELTSTFLVTLGVLGSILFVAGTLGSALSGLSGLLSITGVAGSASIAAIGTAITTVLLPILALVATAILLWKTDLGGFRDFVKETFDIIFDTIGSVLKNIFNAFDRLFKGDLIGVVLELVSGIIKAFLGLGAAVYNVWVWVTSSIKQLFFNMLSGIIDAVISLIKFMNDKLGTSIGTTTLSNISKAVRNIPGTPQYISADSISTAGMGIDKLLGTGEFYKDSQPQVAPQSAPNVNVNVTLDGKQVAESVSTRIMNPFEKTYISGNSWKV